VPPSSCASSSRMHAKTKPAAYSCLSPRRRVHRDLYCHGH
jgi:hypothetical protein